MENNELDKKVFMKNRDKVLEINEHYDGCKYANRSIPIDECMCDCYNRQVFKLGRVAESDMFYS